MKMPSRTRNVVISLLLFAAMFLLNARQQLQIQNNDPCVQEFIDEEAPRTKNHLQHSRSDGVNPAYIKLLDEAFHRADLDWSTMHKQGDKGVIIGPTDGDFKHTVGALQNARRIRSILDGDVSVKIAIMTSSNHIRKLQRCTDATSSNIEKGRLLDYACRLFGNGSLLDDLIATDNHDKYVGNDTNTNIQQGTSAFWLKALAGYHHAPYKLSLFLDSDAYPCPGFDKLYSLLHEPNKSLAWQIPTTAEGDLAIGLEQYQDDPVSPKHFCPGDPQILRDWFPFTYRNTGAVLFSFQRKVSHVFAHFVPLVAEYVYNHVGTPDYKVENDQTPFNIALYIFRRLVPDFLETQIPMHASCRSYPGDADDGGTDGFINGMLPIQKDGTYCWECSCSPCLISHFCGPLLTINGRKGWELKG